MPSPGLVTTNMASEKEGLKGLLDKKCPFYLILITSSFLSDRPAFLESRFGSILTYLFLGCPQGSVLSAFIWNILVEALFKISFNFDYSIIAYADDLVLVSWNKDVEVAVSNLQKMFDASVNWGSTVKLNFNALKTTFIIFYRKRKLPGFSITISGTIINQSYSCMYLGLLIDSKLNWRPHIEMKCIAGTKAWWSIQRCVRRTWGLTRDKLTLLYKTIFLPKILYCCTVWAKAAQRKTIINLLTSTQRKCAVTIARVFKTTSAEVADVLANTLPLDLKIREILIRRALTPMASLLPLSSLSLVSMEKEELTARHPPPNRSLISFRKEEIRKSSIARWNNRWTSSGTGRITHLFFPSVENAFFLTERSAPHTVMQLLSSHSTLNYFLHKIGKLTSPVCECLLDNEDTHHFLFFCPYFEKNRQPMKLAGSESNLLWPPPLSEIPKSKPLWNSLLLFIKSTKRLNRRLPQNAVNHSI